MGCGKSTIGKRIARDCKMSFVDTDAWIEDNEKVTITEIFATKGEGYFRELETRCLEVLLDEGNAEACEATERKVISVGGGLPMREENRNLLKQLGTVIYLKATENTIYNRLKDDTTRPLLQGDNPRKKIRYLMDLR